MATAVWDREQFIAPMKSKIVKGSVNVERLKCDLFRRRAP
jgi:hypothetical protein